MQEIYEFAQRLDSISKKLDLIRELSKNEEDYYNAPFDNDFELLEEILDDKIVSMEQRD